MREGTGFSAKHLATTVYIEYESKKAGSVKQPAVVTALQVLWNSCVCFCCEIERDREVTDLPLALYNKRHVLHFVCKKLTLMSKSRWAFFLACSSLSGSKINTPKSADRMLYITAMVGSHPLLSFLLMCRIIMLQIQPICAHLPIHSC